MYTAGLMDDIRRKIPWYVSDFKDALHIQVKKHSKEKTPLQPFFQSVYLSYMVIH